MAMKSVFGKDWLKTYLNVRLQNFNDHEDPQILMNGQGCTRKNSNKQPNMIFCTTQKFELGCEECV